MTEIAVYSDALLAQALGEVRETYRRAGRCKVKVTTGKRSLNQNDISHVWYAQMAMEDRSEDARGHRRYCKLHHGVPILRPEDDEFRAGYDSVIRPLDYEQKLIAMDFWPVTSRMNKDQMTRFLDAVQKDYRENRNVILEFPMERAA